MEEKQKKVIDLRLLYQLICERKPVFYKVLPVVFVLSCLWIVPQPRYYTSEVVLAPETGDGGASGTISSLASSFGFNIGDAANGDAIYPMLYPDLFQSPAFIVSLFNIELDVPQEEGGTLHTDYYTYMSRHQQHNWLLFPFQQALRTVKRWIKPKKASDAFAGDVSKLDAFRLSYDDYMLVGIVQQKIACAVDKKTEVTTISVTDQNAVVSAVMADSVRHRLQQFITDYRTSKARLDLTYYEQLTDSAKKEYEAAVAAYSRFCDANRNSILQVYLSKRDELENDMQLKSQTYTAMNTQLQAARAKVQERTPAFTVLKNATVPVKPSGPKRMIFVAAMLVLASVAIVFYSVRSIVFSE